MRFERYNPNPLGKNVGDCTIRALSKALRQDWNRTYVGLILEGFARCDMPSANDVWGSYLRKHGFVRQMIPDGDGYTVEDFIDDHPQGTYILALSGHVVCAIDGTLYDTWNSCREIPLYYWMKG